jgi:hypothetical protein
MAIDMIERTDEGVHANSRLGNYQFADESKEFKNFTGGEDFFKGGGEDWANLFGSQTNKKNKIKAREEAEKFVKELPSSKTTTPSCDEISASLAQLQVYIEGQLKEMSSLKGHVTEYFQIRIDTARKSETQLKLAQSKMDCINVQAKAEAQAKKEETLKTITDLSEKSIQNAKTDLLGVNEALQQQATSTSPLTSNKNLLLYGGIGVGAILLILLLRRR